MANEQIRGVAEGTPGEDDFFPWQTATGIESAKKVKKSDLRKTLATYKVLAFKLTSTFVVPSGFQFTKVDLQNDFPGVNVTFDGSVAALTKVIADQPIFTNGKTVMLGTTMNSSGLPYFVVGGEFSTTQFNILCFEDDGTHTSSPYFDDTFIEIRVYN